MFIIRLYAVQSTLSILCPDDIELLKFQFEQVRRKLASALR